MGHSLNRTGFRINQNLVVDDGTFNPGYILVSDLNGIAKWKDPTQYITNDEPLDRFIGELYGGGIVVAVWREQREQLYEYSLIASVKNYSEPYSDGEYFLSLQEIRLIKQLQSVRAMLMRIFMVLVFMVIGICHQPLK